MTAASRKTKSTEVTLLLTNSRDYSVTFVLEPWGETYEFRPGDKITIVALGPLPGYPEVNLSDDALTVCGWPGSTVYVWKNGEEIGRAATERTRVPLNALPVKHT